MSPRWFRSLLTLSLLASCTFPDYDQLDSGGPRCDDGLRNGDETAVDCGPSCAPCAECSDGLKNGKEDGVDCGGSCEPCPSCDDGSQNGSESDVDCGGSCPNRCETDLRCHEHADCASLVCDSVCQPSNCMDGVRNGGETGEDCGGPCAPCANGNACRSAADCQSHQCHDDVCVDAGCTDGKRTGEESDTDCGGPSCAPCPDGASCEKSEDCASAICSAAGACDSASCDDGVKNQGESDTDCGGASCAACIAGQSCAEPSDCEQKLCQNGTCVPAAPQDQPLQRKGWALSSSEADTEQNPAYAFDSDLGTRWTSGKTQYSGMFVDIDLGAPRVFFKILLQATESPFSDDYPKSVDVFTSNDGTFASPVLTSVTGGQWTWVELKGAQVARYVRVAIHTRRDHRWSIGEINVYE